tara:strand:+ start:1118 stop:1813 length:696 start_codon:yes stop_codon:yes gene_type:complete
LNITPALPPYPTITPPASEQLAGDNRLRPAVRQSSSAEGEQTPQSKQSNSDDKAPKSEDREAKQPNSEDAKELQRLKQRDREVRLHEQAHAAVGGRYASAPSYEYERGSDGKSYAVGGEVQIDVSEVEGDPQATIEKMTIVKRAALAPAEPSGADRAIASEANQKASAARAELAQQNMNPSRVEQTQGDPARSEGSNQASRSPETSSANVVGQRYSKAVSPSADPGFRAFA